MNDFLRRLMKSTEMNLSLFISMSAIIILLGYIIQHESHQTVPSDAFSDEGVAPIEIFEEGAHPYPAVAFELPKEVNFAGEPVPLHIPDVRERLDKELQINSYLHSNTIFLVKRANRWFPEMEKILKQYGIPEDFIYLPLIESNLMNVTSPKDAVGFWQILETSGREFGLEVTKEVDQRYDPIKSTEAACRYLKKAHGKFGNWTLVAASYNRGMNGVDKALDNQQVASYYDLYLNEETSRYVFRILAIKEIMKNPTRYGFKIDPRLTYERDAVEYVTVDETINDLISFSKKHGINYKLLKYYNPWLRDDRLTVKNGRSYQIAIPQAR